MRFRIFMFAALWAATAQADCAPDMGVFAFCDIKGRDAQVSVCYDEETVIYSFGPGLGPPELVLSEPIATVDFQPWPGIGRDIAESVTFSNDGYGYRVVAGFERMFEDQIEEDTAGHFGRVEILRDGEKQAELICDPDSVAYSFGEGLYDLKLQAGLEWDDSIGEWKPAS